MSTSGAYNLFSEFSKCEAVSAVATSQGSGWESKFCEVAKRGRVLLRRHLQQTNFPLKLATTRSLGIGGGRIVK